MDDGGAFYVSYLSLATQFQWGGLLFDREDCRHVMGIIEKQVYGVQGESV